MRNAFLQAAREPSERDYASYDNLGFGKTCLPSFKSFQINIDIQVGKAASAEQLAHIKALYNEATSNGTDLFSRFGYSVGRISSPPSTDPEMTLEKYKFLICREDFGAEVLAAPWY